jgi:protein-disulfide isomerase
MRLSLIAGLLLAACFAANAQSASPTATTADPTNGKRGDVITITGSNLSKTTVAKVYLTDEKNDVVVEVTEQTATSIKFKIPEKATGRMSVMFLTADKEPKFIEQPIKVTVQE